MVLVLPHLGYVTFMILNLLKIPILYFIRVVSILAAYLVVLSSFFFAMFLLRQRQILFEFLCLNTILSSANMVLLGSDQYLYYFWSNIVVMFTILFLSPKVGILHLLGLPGGLLFFPKIQVLLSLSGYTILLLLSGFQVLYFLMAK